MVSFPGGSDVETSRVPLKLHHTFSLPAQIAQHLGEQVLKVAIVDGTGGIKAIEARIGEIEGGAELMGGRVGGVTVHSTEALHRRRGTEQGCDSDTIAVASTPPERIDEILSYPCKKSFGLRHKKGQ